MKTTFILCALFLLAPSCKNKLTSNWKKDFDAKVAENERKWAEQERLYQEKVQTATTFGAALEAETGQRFEHQKFSNDGWVVYKNSTTGEFVAYDLTTWDRNTMTSFSQYTHDASDIVRNLEAKSRFVENGYYQDKYEYQHVYESPFDFECNCFKPGLVYKEVLVGQEWVDMSFTAIDYTNGDFTFQNAGSPVKDLETLAAVSEGDHKKAMALTFKNKYSLSASRAEELAQLSYSYMRLENKRELTPSEKNQFAMKSLGVSLAEVERAMRLKLQGHDQIYKDVLKTAAEVNKTSPEMIGQFFEDFSI